MSQPYNGIEEWFEVGKDLVVVNNEDEAVEAYQWLLASGDECHKFGENARERIFREHTYHNRAEFVMGTLARCYKHTYPVKTTDTTYPVKRPLMPYE